MALNRKFLRTILFYIVLIGSLIPTGCNFTSNDTAGGGGGGGGTLPPDENTPVNSANIFFSGHSLLDHDMITIMPGIVSSLGKTMQYNRQGIGGSPIRVRTRGSSSESGNQYAGYSQGTNRDWSTGLNIIDEFLDPQTLGPGDRYDTLVITERHDSVSVVIWENTVRYLRHYHERLRAGNPNAQTYFYEPWLSFIDTKLPEWFAYENEAKKLWECVVTRINHSLAAENRTDRIKSIPAARALTFLVQRATTGNVPGITANNTAATLDVLFTDDVHTTAVGGYYMSLVVYARVFKSTPVGASYPIGVTATQAQSLQAIAWEFMSNYLSTYEEPTLAQCQTMAPTVCTAFWNYDWAYANNPSQIPGCQNALSSSSNSNPMYYSPTTDGTYWFPPPAL